MPILRLAYTTLFLIALLAVFELWSQVGGQSHLDLMPWYFKLVLGSGAAFATVKATAAAVNGDKVWNFRTLKWAGILLAVLVGCGLSSYYYHLYEEQQDDQDDTVSSGGVVPSGHLGRIGMPARDLHNDITSSERAAPGARVGRIGIAQDQVVKRGEYAQQ